MTKITIAIYNFFTLNNKLTNLNLNLTTFLTSKVVGALGDIYNADRILPAPVYSVAPRIIVEPLCLAVTQEHSFFQVSAWAAILPGGGVL